MGEHPPEIQAELIRVQRLLEEALDRYAGQDEPARADALARALQAEVAGLPADRRASVLSSLGALYAEAPAAPSGDGADRRAVERLEQELARLREALAAAQAKPATAATSVVRGPLLEEIGAVLTGATRRSTALDMPGADERTVAVVRALVEFTASLARGYLSVGLDPDKTMSGHLAMVISDELEGKRPAGSVKALLEQMRQQIGSQVLAFRQACDIGARELLRQLSPTSLAAEGKSRLFHYKECWEAFETRYEELRRADNVFETYFDVAFQRVMRSLLGKAEAGRTER